MTVELLIILMEKSQNLNLLELILISQIMSRAQFHIKKLKIALQQI